MIDTQIMKDMLAGLESRKKILQENEKAFLKASGLNEEIEKAAQEREGYQVELADAKKKRDGAKARKGDAIAAITSEIERKINEVLPFGKAIFSYNEDDVGNRSMKIGWSDGGKITPYNGLSGGQKQIFDAALALVLDADIIVVEAAELDYVNLDKILHELSKLDKQVIVNTCHPIDFDIPENFTLVEV